MANLSRRSMLKATFGLAGTTGLGLLVACSAQAPVAPTSAPAPPETIVPGKPAATSTAPATLKGTRIVGTSGADPVGRNRGGPVQPETSQGGAGLRREPGDEEGLSS